MRGIEFGVNGTQTPFNFGTPLNQTLFNTPNSSKGNCYNCSATEAGGTYQYFMLAAPYHTTNLFGYASYQVTDDITASFEAEFGATEAKNVANPKRITLTIKQDNAYLDPAILAQMQAGGIPTFRWERTMSSASRLARRRIPPLRPCRRAWAIRPTKLIVS